MNRYDYFSNVYWNCWYFVFFKNVSLARLDGLKKVISWKKGVWFI